MLHTILLILHVISVVLIIGLWVANFKPPKVLPGQFHAALLAFITGLTMYILATSNGAQISHMGYGIKMLIALAIVICAFIGQKKYKQGLPVPTGLAHAVGGLAVINVIIALTI